MLKDVLFPELERTFPSCGLQMKEVDGPHPTAVFLAKHPAVGDASVQADGEEATVSIGRITHGHFNPHLVDLTEAARDQWITARVVEFLTALFADQVLLTLDPRTGGGGWEVLSDFDELEAVPPEVHAFLWSGPVDVQGGGCCHA